MPVERPPGRRALAVTDPAGVAGLLQAVARWAAATPGIRAVALVGSRAAGRARPDSDVDLVVLADDPGPLLAHPAWLGEFGEVLAVGQEDWGAITSLRARYAEGLEVEWGLGRPSWAAVAPVDPGTERVAAAGLLALYDPEGLLARLAAAVPRRTT